MHDLPPQMRIVHDAHLASDEGPVGLILPDGSQVANNFTTGLPISQLTDFGYFENTAKIVEPEVETVANFGKYVTNGVDEAVQVTVHTAIRDEVRRRLLLKRALEVLTILEFSVAELTDEQAAEAMESE